MDNNTHAHTQGGGLAKAADAATAADAALSSEQFLVGTVGLTLKGMGRGDDGSSDPKVSKPIEAAMSQLFEKYVYGSGADGYFHYGDHTIYVFNGKCFEEKDERYLHSLVKKVMGRCDVGEVYQTYSHNVVFQNCLLGLECQYPEFERDRRYLVFDNCVLDLEEDKTLPFSHEIKSDLQLNFEYTPGAKFPLWERFIINTIPSDEMRQAFQMFCGAFLVERKRAKIEFACYLIGSGRNGKSVAVSAISSVFGPKLVSWFSPQQLFSDNTCMYNRAKTDGKFANFSDDVKASDYSGGDFKQFVSGQPFEARNPFGRPYTMKSVPFMVLCVNSMPPTTDDTNGHYRRILPIICPNQISDDEVDPELTSKLQTAEAKQGIFNWIYEGYKMLRNNDWRVSIGNNVVEAQQELMADSNSFRRWLRDTCYVPWNPEKDGAASGGGIWKSRREMMSEYSKYCEEMSESAKSIKAVGMILADLGFVKVRRNDGFYYAMKQSAVYGTPYGVAAQADEDLPF